MHKSKYVIINDVDYKFDISFLIYLYSNVVANFDTNSISIYKLDKYVICVIYKTRL